MWQNLARLGVARRGMARIFTEHANRLRFGEYRRGGARRCMAGPCVAGRGEARIFTEHLGRGQVRRGLVRHEGAWYGMGA